MGFIEKRNGKYRARYRDPLGHQRSETFSRKGDAERFLREMQVDIKRGRWIDPAGGDMALGAWAEEFLSLARRLGRLPADEIENWLNDEIASGLAPSSVQPRQSLRGARLFPGGQFERGSANALGLRGSRRDPLSAVFLSLSWLSKVFLSDSHASTALHPVADHPRIGVLR